MAENLKRWKKKTTEGVIIKEETRDYWLKRSSKARLKKSASLSRKITATLLKFQNCGVDETKMPELRRNLFDLVQCFHEFNAYRNAKKVMCEQEVDFNNN